jgi:GNAT superfamily N-acetyltransferase
MRAVLHEHATKFWAVAEPLLTADPVDNTITITVLNRLLRGMSYGPDAPILVTVHAEDGDRLLGAAMSTPPHPLCVTALPEDTMPEVIAVLRAAKVQLPGAQGQRDRVETFVRLWTADPALRSELVMRERLYRLDLLTPPAGIPGTADLATTGDIPLLADWRRAFSAEALANSGATLLDAVEQTRSSLAAGSANLFWRVDGEPVALAVVGSPNAGMSRIGPVYTPPAHRGHGYGSAVTAVAGRWALAQGAGHVVLFTDLANPTSNSIYQKIGFRPVADQLKVDFVPHP